MLELSAAALSVLALLGSFLLLFLLTGAVWLATQGLRAHVLPYFSGHHVDLVERFGSWADLSSAALPLAFRSFNMSVILIALALMCQSGIYGKAINSFLGPFLSYAERFYMCEPDNRQLPWTWYLRASHYNPLKPNELQRLTGNVTIANEPLDDSCWIKIIVDTRSNNQWKENAIVCHFKKNAYRAIKENVPGFYERFFKRGDDKEARHFKPRVYEVNNETIDWSYPNVPIVPYGQYRFRVLIGKAENQYACWVVNSRVIPKPGQT
ncbi:uncharacterized protein LOC113212465 isoform X2 [Frankliniella occidentalis]|nr:uncharacterized protein LOC113212465 isoform X2 [Frankliniella occidentalis]